MSSLICKVQQSQTEMFQMPTTSKVCAGKLVVNKREHGIHAIFINMSTCSIVRFLLVNVCVYNSHTFWITSQSLQYSSLCCRLYRNAHKRCMLTYQDLFKQVYPHLLLFVLQKIYSTVGSRSLSGVVLLDVVGPTDTKLPQCLLMLSPGTPPLSTHGL